MTGSADTRLAQLTTSQRAALARRLRQDAGSHAEPVLARYPGPPDRSPLGLDQERLWTLTQLDPDSTAYNISVGLRFRGPLDAHALRHALDDLVLRHELLRSTMHFGDGAPYLKVHERLEPGFREADLRDIHEGERADEMAAAIRTHTAGAFDLETGPLLRVLIVHLADDDHQIVETMHHAVTDQWSFVRLNAELVEHYRARLEDRPSALPPLPVQYGDFARWQREWFTGARRHRHRAFWAEELRGAPSTLALPYDASPETPSRAGRHHYFVVPDDTGTAFIAMARQERITLATALLATYAALLYEETGQTDIVVGVPSATRQAETQNLIGFLLTSVPLRLRLGPNPTPAGILTEAARVAVVVADHREVPFSEIVEAVAPERSLHRYPVMQTLHLVLDFEESIFDVPGAEVHGTEVEDGVSPMDLTVGWWRAGTTLYGRFEYRTALFHESTVSRWATRLTELLSLFLSAPDAPLRGPVARGSSSFDLAPAEPPEEGGQSLDAPETQLLVSEAWAAVLGTRPATPTISFFEAGGTSMLAVRFALELREAGLEASVRDIFLFPRLRDLAATLAGRTAEPPRSTVNMVSEARPLTPEQLDVLAFEPANPERWSHTVALTLRSPVDPERVRTAVGDGVRAHPALTASFVLDEQGPLSRPGGTWSWSVASGGDTDEDVSAAQLADFDLARGHVFAATLIPDADTPRIVLTANHLVTDGMSWAVLAADLADALRDRPVMPERGSYGAYAAAVRACDYSSQLPFWRSQLQGLPQASGRGGRLEDEREIVVEAATDADPTSVGAATLVCVARAVARLRRDWADPVFDIVADGREPVGQPDRYDLIRGVGSYATAYPLRLLARPDRPVEDDVPRVLAAVASVPGGGKGWLALAMAAGPAQWALFADLPRPAVSFNFVGSLGELHEVAPEVFSATREIGRRPYPGAKRTHEIAVVAGIHTGRLVVRWQYDGSTWTEQEVRASADAAIVEIVAAVAAVRRASARAVDAGSGLSFSQVNNLFAELHRRSR